MFFLINEMSAYRIKNLKISTYRTIQTPTTIYLQRYRPMKRDVKFKLIPEFLINTRVIS